MLGSFRVASCVSSHNLPMCLRSASTALGVAVAAMPCWPPELKLSGAESSLSYSKR